MIRASDWWLLDLQQPAPSTTTPNEDVMTLRLRTLMVRLLVKLVGGGVFVGLLVAAHYLPAWATPLRVVALLWFAGMIVLTFALWAASER